MIYAAFGMWLFLILVTATGLYRFWTKCFGGALIDWILLPGTLAGELAFNIGRIATGRPAYAGIISPKDPREDPCRYAISGKNGFPIELLCAALTMLACGTGLGFSVYYLGESVIPKVIFELGVFDTAVSKEFPLSWESFWVLLTDQTRLLRRMCEVWTKLDWGDWCVPGFLYFSGVFILRFGPVRHDFRASILVGIAIPILLSIVGLVWTELWDIINGDFWCVLTYLWGLMLFILAVTLVGAGLTRLIKTLLRQGKPSPV